MTNQSALRSHFGFSKAGNLTPEFSLQLLQIWRRVAAGTSVAIGVAGAIDRREATDKLTRERRS